MRFPAALACLVVILLVVSASAAAAEGLSREQGDAILEELRRIRILLEQQPRRPGPPPQGPAPLGPASLGPAAPGPALQFPVAPERVTLALGGDYSLGRADAPITIVEYTDYQCAFCERFRTDTYPDIKRNFIDTGKVRFVVRDLPLVAHPEALKAAQAGRCAGDQGKFWEMYDLLSANSAALGKETYVRLARDLALDARTFQACIESDRHLSDIRAGVQGAAAAGITGTPSFVIGTVRGATLEGVRIVGAQSYSVFEKTIGGFLR